jgi:hypothetical protein
MRCGLGNPAFERRTNPLSEIVSFVVVVFNAVVQLCHLDGETVLKGKGCNRSASQGFASDDVT